MTLKTDSSCLKSCQSYLEEYCENTSIHGLKFLGEKKRSLVERLWWLTFLLISLYFCITSILQAYSKWDLFPVVVSFSTSETPVWKIPFPAVTICPQTKAQRKLVNYTDLVLKMKNGEILDNKTSTEYQRMSMLCRTQWNSFDDTHNLSGIINGDELISFFMKVQPRFYDTVEKCFWLGKDLSTDIDRLFIPVITNEGICYSFNLLDRSEMFTEEVDNNLYENFPIPHIPSTKWSIEKGYQADSDLSSFPYRSVMSGLQGGLDLTLFVNSSDLDYFCGDTLQGYKVILHNPLQLPYAKQRHFFVGLNEDVIIAVKPNMITTSKTLEHYKPLHRKCFFTHEKKLRFFKVYDQKNCLQECLSNFTYNHCGCVGFYMLHDNSTPICGLRMDECIKEAIFARKVLFLAMFLVNDIKLKMKHQQTKIKENLKNNINTEKCNCIPTCNSLTFEAEVSQTDWRWKEAANILSKKAREFSKTTHCSRLQIFFKDMQFIASERNELYGNMDFLASCGGLFGLFIGFSFISIVEILYYLSLRLFCNFLNSSKRNVKEDDSV